MPIRCVVCISLSHLSLASYFTGSDKSEEYDGSPEGSLRVFNKYKGIISQRDLDKYNERTNADDKPGERHFKVISKIFSTSAEVFEHELLAIKEAYKTRKKFEAESKGTFICFNIAIAHSAS